MNMFDCYPTEPDCYFSNQSKPHNLSLQSNLQFSTCFSCKSNHLDHRRNQFYYCSTCNLQFHIDCYHLSPKIKHPFHISHPLILTFSNHNFDTSSQIFSPNLFSKTPKRENGDFSICKCCFQHLKKLYYHCSICNFSLNVSCSRNPPSLTIKNPKNHEHDLTLFPIRPPLPCVACGLSLNDSSDLVYTCFPCTYMIHKSCIDLPRVIKITRHSHRLSPTFSIPRASDLPCGVCRKTVDINYGKYSCIKGCSYVVHSKCATSEKVWDGKDLEGILEEPEEDVTPFFKIDEKTIQHFSHKHCLKLRGRDGEKKFCQACTLPVIQEIESFYSCMLCDFILHETCANLPLKLSHPLHKHNLTLLVKLSNLKSYPTYPFVFVQGMFKCNGCRRGCCGFVYKCDKKDCEFLLDTRCASLPDPIIHKSHPQDHPLFFNLTKGVCKSCPISFIKPDHFVECMKCKFFLDLNCATLPHLVYYKHDKHRLFLSYGEEETTNLQYWCEVCESKLDAKTWFYTCNSCQVTIHVECLIDRHTYMKPNHVIKIFDDVIKIVRNDGNSRPICDACGIRCVERLGVKSLCRNFCNIFCMSRLLFGENEENILKNM